MMMKNLKHYYEAYLTQTLVNSHIPHHKQINDYIV